MVMLFLQYPHFIFEIMFYKNFAAVGKHGDRAEIRVVIQYDSFYFEYADRLADIVDLRNDVVRKRQPERRAVRKRIDRLAYFVNEKGAYAVNRRE
jgi:hypothetical protein